MIICILLKNFDFKYMNELVQAKDEELAVKNNYDGVSAADLAPGLSNNADDSGEGSSSSNSSDDGANKLTRAQRKRLRRKKLKTDTSRRRKIIGPLLPPADDDDNGSEAKNLALENGSPTVRRNAAEESPPRTDQPGKLGFNTFLENSIWDFFFFWPLLKLQHVELKITV